jgi:oxygen-independent coproporphyrinogen-3 oxidase
VIPTTEPIGIYLHLPFCRRKCQYCDFLSFGGWRGVPDGYVDTLLGEVQLWGSYFADSNATVASVYFGGGTPSLAEPRQVERLMTALRSAAAFGLSCETTLEANPDSIDENRVAGWMAAGVNRLSIGIQSLDDPTLRRLGRLHDASRALQACTEARRAGIGNVSVDLMYGLPGTDSGTELLTLQRVLEEIHPDHVSWYNLTPAQETPLWVSLEEGRLSLPEDDAAADLMNLGWRMLEEHGYEHYEISSFALPGRESQHNLGYWQYRDYVGLGLGASGFVAGRRWTNARSMGSYQDAVAAGNLPVESEERLPARRSQGEYAMLCMRMPILGLQFDQFRRLFGVDAQASFGVVFEQLVAEGLLVMMPDRAICSRRGLELNNVVARAFIDASMDDDPGTLAGDGVTSYLADARR